MTKEKFKLKLNTLEKIYKNTEPEILESLKLIISNDFFYTKDNLKEKLQNSILFLEENPKAFDNESLDITNSASISSISEANDTTKSILSISRDISREKEMTLNSLQLQEIALLEKLLASKKYN